MARCIRAIGRGDYWKLPLKGEAVARCGVDEAFGLEFGIDKRSFVLRIEERCSIL